VTQIQRGELSDGVRRRFRMSNDGAPDEVADAFSAVEVVENDRPENMALLGTRMVSAVGSAGAGGAGNFNYWQIHNPFGSGVLITVYAFRVMVSTTVTAGNSPPMMVDLNFADSAPIIGAKVGNGSFMDTRLDLQSGGAQPLPAGELWLQTAAAIGGGAWRPMFRVPVITANSVQPIQAYSWPTTSPTIFKCPYFVLAPNSTLLCNLGGTDNQNVVTQFDAWWTERLMGELEATFQQDTRHWTL
jgi:hypothetical protein